MTPPRFVVGIDLGTTNSAVASADTGAGGDPAVRVLAVPQVVGPGKFKPAMSCRRSRTCPARTSSRPGR